MNGRSFVDRGSSTEGYLAMKLIIQIPCYNEEESLPVVLAGLPSR